MKTYQAFCEQQIEALFQLIETHGGLLQWQKTWQVAGARSLPLSQNGFYQGINLMRLLMEQIDRGWTSPYWLTFRQIQQCGGYVLKGAKGTTVCFWKLREIESAAPLATDETPATQKLPIFKTYTVFNRDQTSLAETPEIHLPMINTVAIDDWLQTKAFSLSHFGNQPHYNSQEDVVVMPVLNHFNQPQDYYVTLLHELVHWTGHASRLNRASFRDYSKTESRAEEELVAEIGSVLLASYFGLSGDLLNHASYVATWKQHLDEKAVARASSQAAKAFHWLIHDEQERA